MTDPIIIPTTPRLIEAVRAAIGGKRIPPGAKIAILPPPDPIHESLMTGGKHGCRPDHKTAPAAPERAKEVAPVV